ncbi:MAG: hypothetical protein ACREN5_08085, partial [Gemmatimonadales bacterium]
MAERNGGRIALLVIGAGLLLSSTLQLVRFASQRDDIWWTPLELAVPLAQAGDRVEVYVQGTHLAQLVNQGRLRVTSGSESRVAAEGDVVLRFNNWDRMRADRTTVVALAAFAAGVGLCFV